MHRIDTPGNQSGLFVAPNPLTGQQPVKVDSAWLNDLQENIMAVLLAGDIAPVKGDANNLRDAITAIITGDFPAFVSSFNTRTGNVVLEGEDVVEALGYTPVNRAGDTITGNLSVQGTIEGFTNSGDHGVRVRGAADGSAAIFQFTDHNGATEWARLSIGAPGQAVAMNGHALATLDSPALTGDPTAPTAAPGTRSTQVATCDFAGQVGCPPGMIAPFGQGAAPGGWLACDGSAVSRADHANLYAAITVTYGAGDGATTFNVPDLRGPVRAWRRRRRRRRPRSRAGVGTGRPSRPDPAPQRRGDQRRLRAAVSLWQHERGPAGVGIEHGPHRFQFALIARQNIRGRRDRDAAEERGPALLHQDVRPLDTRGAKRLQPLRRRL